MPGLQTVALSVVAGRGARSEDEARSGWSHLLEHMVFKGAGGRSARQIVEVMTAIPPRGFYETLMRLPGELNGGKTVAGLGVMLAHVFKA